MTIFQFILDIRKQHNDSFFILFIFLIVLLFCIGRFNKIGYTQQLRISQTLVDQFQTTPIHDGHIYSGLCPSFYPNFEVISRILTTLISELIQTSLQLIDSPLLKFTLQQFLKYRSIMSLSSLYLTQHLVSLGKSIVPFIPIILNSLITKPIDRLPNLLNKSLKTCLNLMMCINFMKQFPKRRFILQIINYGLYWVTHQIRYLYPVCSEAFVTSQFQCVQTYLGYGQLVGRAQISSHCLAYQCAHILFQLFSHWM